MATVKQNNWTHTCLVSNGLKKQSISLRRLQARLLSRDVMTSFTDVRTNVMEACVKAQKNKRRKKYKWSYYHDLY